MKTYAFLGIGSNLGQRVENIRKALSLIGENPSVDIVSISSFYETEPVSCIPQGYYLNGVVKIYTDYTPEQLLVFLQGVEKKLGRVRGLKDAPRTIDIDILIYGDLRMNTENLCIPHPRMKEREFVLKPLFEIEPTLKKTR